MAGRIMDLNRITIIGRLVRDPDLKSTNSGSFICRFSIASNKRVKSGDGWTDKAGFFDCVCFGKQAENAIKYLAKGKRVAIDGSLDWSSWEKDGKKMSKVEIAVDSYQFLDPKSESAGGGVAMAADEDIPF